MITSLLNNVRKPQLMNEEQARAILGVPPLASPDQIAQAAEQTITLLRSENRSHEIKVVRQAHKCLTSPNQHQPLPYRFITFFLCQLWSIISGFWLHHTVTAMGKRYTLPPEIPNVAREWGLDVLHSLLASQADSARYFIHLTIILMAWRTFAPRRFRLGALAAITYWVAAITCIWESISHAFTADGYMNQIVASAPHSHYTAIFLGVITLCLVIANFVAIRIDDKKA